MLAEAVERDTLWDVHSAFSIALSKSSARQDDERCKDREHHWLQNSIRR